EIDAGKVDNRSKEWRVSKAGRCGKDDGRDSVTLPAAGAVAVDKSGVLDDTFVAPSGRADAGDKVNYTITIQNTGNVTLHSVLVTDPGCAAAPAYVSGDGNLNGKLDVGETRAYSCSHTVTQAEIDAGKVDNTATGSALIPSGSSVNDDGSASVTLPAAGAVAVDKSGVGRASC